MVGLETFAALAAATPEIATVETSEGVAFLRSLSALERDQWEHWYYSNVDAHRGLFRASLVAACLCDENGVLLCEPTYNGAHQQAILSIANAPADFVDPLFARAGRLAGVTPDDETRAENAEKNLVSAGQTAGA